MVHLGRDADHLATRSAITAGALGLFSLVFGLSSQWLRGRIFLTSSVLAMVFGEIYLMPLLAEKLIVITPVRHLPRPSGSQVSVSPRPRSEKLTFLTAAQSRSSSPRRMGGRNRD